MATSNLHDSLIVVDGLIISDWGEQAFRDMQAGGITAANCTASVWENYGDTMSNLSEWKRWFRDYSKLMAAMERRGSAEPKIRRVLGDNWLRLLEEVWGAASA